MGGGVSGEGGHRDEMATVDWKGSQRWASPSYQAMQAMQVMQVTCRWTVILCLKEPWQGALRVGTAQRQAKAGPSPPAHAFAT